MWRGLTKWRLVHRGLREYFAGLALDLLPARRGWDGYQRRDFAADVKSGLNVALLALPQGMAFAMIAGVDVAHGIACAAVAAVAAALFCGSRYTALGPTNATAFTVFSFFATYPALGARQAELMPLLAVMVALLFLGSAVFRVAEMVQYISRSVMVGYVSGAALLIMASQMKDLLGVSLADEAGLLPRTFFSTAIRLVQVAPSMHWPSLAVGAATVGLVVFLSKWRPAWPGFALVLVVVSGLAEVAGLWEPSFRSLPMLEPVRAADLHPRLPGVSARTLDDAGALFGLAVAIAFIGALETSVMVKGLAGRGTGKENLDQDMYGVGMANLGSAFVGGLPVSCSLTRSALAYATGAKSRLAMLVNGLACGVLAVAFGTLVGHVPRAVLGGLVVAVAWKLFNVRQIRICLTATRSDAATLVCTVLATLVVPLHVAIFTGVALSVVLYLRKASRPELVEYDFNAEGTLAETRQRRVPAISIVHVEGDLFFGAADLFRTQVQRTMQDPMLKVIILRLRNARNLDATSVMALDELLKTVRADGRHLIISGVTKDVYRVMRNSGLLDVLGKQNLFIHSTGNPNVSTRNALKRAQALLGTRQADIQIFVDQNKKRSGPVA